MRLGIAYSALLRYVYTFALSVLLFACNRNFVWQPDTNGDLLSSSSEQSVAFKIPAMHNKVVAYVPVNGYGNVKFIDNKEIIEKVKPSFSANIFYDEKCNYFATIFSSIDDLSYMVLSQDMKLYSIRSNPISYNGTECIDSFSKPTYQAMFICDDELGTIRNSLDFNSIIDYIDLDWDCRNGKNNARKRGAYYWHEASSSSSAKPEPIVAMDMPIMSYRVVSYQSIMRTEIDIDKYSGIITDKEILKFWFPNDYDEQNEECNYFAIYSSPPSTYSGYLVLADDMVLYRLDHEIKPECIMTTDLALEAMLVCDDKDNTFANNINWNGIYVVPSWECNDWRTAPERVFFSDYLLPY